MTLRATLPVRVSRALNTLLRGDPHETLCTRIHRCKWRRAERLIDWAFFSLRGDICHCRTLHDWERADR